MSMLNSHVESPLLHSRALIRRVKVIHYNDRRLAARKRCRVGYWHRHRWLLRDTGRNALSTRWMGSWRLSLGTAETRYRHGLNCPWREWRSRKWATCRRGFIVTRSLSTSTTPSSALGSPTPARHLLFEISNDMTL
jgi:hypothetical protein